ncbi:radical SAM protein [Arcobacter sp. 31_11_sub10_T18]|nr:radical SAM protein [Arcobacter sp. 31_11_sub10_T18]
MPYSNSLTFGPIPSRRFGISLGIDLSPATKQCNFDCLYCELEAAATVTTMETFPKVSEVVRAVQDAFAKHEKIDVLTITANGEPTLYPHLDRLVDELDKIKGNAKTLILSNGANIYDKSIQQTLTKIDTVKLSLDCVSLSCFKKLDRIDSTIDVEQIVEGMIEFRALHKKAFVLEVLFVKTLNDKPKEIELLYEAIKKINPDRVDIGTIDRPPAYKVKPVTYETLSSIANSFEGINVNIAYKNRPKAVQNFDEDEIISLLQRRPLTLEDIDNLFTQKSQISLQSLVNSGKVKLVDSSGVKFYKIL